MENQGRITACDVSVPRLEGATKRLRRAGIHNAETHLLEAGDRWVKRRAGTFDRVLVAMGRSPNGKKIDAEKAGVQVTDRGFIPADRQMRTNLQFVNPDNPPKVIAVTSAVPLEGKTSASANIAISFASAGYKTLMIEADMRRPKLNQYMVFVKRRPGLSEILSPKNRGPISARLKKLQWIFEDSNLTVLSSGVIPPNPSELLGSDAFTELVAYARNNYDYVIIDCPPTLLVADAAIIATQCDGVVLVTRVGKTRKNQFLGARENLNAVGANVVGVLMNMVPQSRTDEYGRKYGYGNGYGYRGSRSYRSYRSYGSYGSEYGYDPVHSYAPEEVAKRVEREMLEGDKSGSK
jgi:receptor protein-tyrosine kinase